MLVMTYTDARQNLSFLLNQTLKDGVARIKRADGSVFQIEPFTENSDEDEISMLDSLKSLIPEIEKPLSRQEFNTLLQEIRDEDDDRADRNNFPVKMENRYFNIFNKKGKE